MSVLYVTEEGDSAEIAVAGNEGLVGIALFMGGESTPNRAVVQSAGEGYIAQHSGVPCVCAPMSDQMIMGGTLPWLCFAIATHANLTEGNSRPINDFGHATLEAYPSIHHAPP